MAGGEKKSKKGCEAVQGHTNQGARKMVPWDKHGGVNKGFKICSPAQALGLSTLGDTGLQQWWEDGRISCSWGKLENASLGFTNACVPGSNPNGTCERE